MLFERRVSGEDRSCSQLEKPSQALLLGRYLTAKRERPGGVVRDLGVHHLSPGRGAFQTIPGGGFQRVGLVETIVGTAEAWMYFTERIPPDA